MDNIMNILRYRLDKKGVSPSHVPYLMRDVLNILKDDRFIPFGNINERLENLGWGKSILDEFNFELILSTMEFPSIHDQ